MYPLTAVMFDIDGTLTDSVDIHAIAWQEALRHFGYRLPYERVRRQIGKGGDQLLQTLLSRSEFERSGEELDHYRGELFKSKYMKLIRPLSMVPELFQPIRRQGTRIVLASSAKRDEVEQYEKLLHIEDLVEHETSADDAERSKPHPDIFQAAMERLGNPPAQEVVAVGDTPYDAQATAAISVACIGVLSGGWSADELRQAGCIQVYAGPADLLARFADSALGTKQREAA
ncbi:MAG TPA: HAD family hydrolase [Candidatus Angelobacter sp.]|nr:HAD family hydrolase [Candidatus Angelobacter sp.]